MTEGFIFDDNRCVACGACSAACILENGWAFSPRNIYLPSLFSSSPAPLANLSLACNHCSNAACLGGCPAGALSREVSTGAVLIDDTKCIGCRYCQWNCPYDAPKYLIPEKIIGKCNLCNTLLKDGILPACARSCPTGALEYGALAVEQGNPLPEWFPGTELEPRVEFTGMDHLPVRVVPEHIFSHNDWKEPKKNNKDDKKWSLIAFTFLLTLSVSKLGAGLINGVFPGKVVFISIIVVASVLSLFHLGRKERAWMAVLNIKKSPLSREIIMFIIYALLSATAVVLTQPGLMVTAFIAGLILLLLVDGVYVYSRKDKTVYLHSGQTFIMALLVISFMTGKILPFAFIAVLRLSASIAGIYIAYNRDNQYFAIRFVRFALLMITGVSLISGISSNNPLVLYLFLAGELLDRILFYIDFKPLNISAIFAHQITGVRK
jgi:Fe-S-cluster-containing dehydrogenase component/DMSO reductase anchor subunit